MKYKAPAVHQAVEVMEFLSRSGPVTLTGIADRTGFSKATILRVLDTLEAHGWISRDRDNKTFELQVIIRSKDDLINYPEQRIQEIIDDLCKKTNHTVEWYRLGENFAEIIQRSEPVNRTVFIRAKLGFRRPFFGEFEAVIKVAAAPGAMDCRKYEPEGGYEMYRNGEKIHIPIDEVINLVSQIGGELLTYDLEWNSNGIRRHAVGVRNQSGQLCGILAVATSFTPRADSDIESINSVLKLSGKKLEKLFNM